MIDLLPEARKLAFRQWEELFTKSSQEYHFNVEIHGVGLSFKLKNQPLLAALQSYFPKSWIRSEKQKIFIEWIAPPPQESESEWDEIEDPHCFFEDQFVWQRDFFVKKVSPFHLQLICYEKIEDGFYNFLRYLLPEKLLEINKILFHSSCVVFNESTPALFFGPSGAGKTTMASFFDKESILGDDMTLLTVSDHKIQVEAATVGQRFFNHDQIGQQYHLKNLYWLVQSQELSCQPIQAHRMQYLLSSVTGLFWQKLSPVQINQIFTLLNKIQTLTQIQFLHFTKNKEVVAYVRSIPSSL